MIQYTCKAWSINSCWFMWPNERKTCRWLKVFFYVWKIISLNLEFFFYISMKRAVVNCLKTFLNEVNVTGNTIKEYLNHSGKEFNNSCVHKMFHSKGINVSAAMSYTPQQNGCTESETGLQLKDPRFHDPCKGSSY